MERTRLAVYNRDLLSSNSSNGKSNTNCVFSHGNAPQQRPSRCSSWQRVVASVVAFGCLASHAAAQSSSLGNFVMEPAFVAGQANLSGKNCALSRERSKTWLQAITCKNPGQAAVEFKSDARTPSTYIENRVSDAIRQQKLPFTPPQIANKATPIVRSIAGTKDTNTLMAVCSILGYSEYVSSSDVEPNDGRCNFTTPGDDYLWRFDGEYRIAAATATATPISTPTAIATPSGQCSDGIDNDGDGLIDALVELAADNGKVFTYAPGVDPGPQFSIAIGNMIRTKKMALTPPGTVNGRAAGIVRSDNANWSNSGTDNAAGSLDTQTLGQVCKVLGYRDYVSSSCRDSERSGRYPSGKCNFHSTSDNYMWRFSGGDFRAESANPKYSKTWITSITCKNQLAACSDGIDNDGDGKVDMADAGCATANDTDERGHDTSCTKPTDPSESSQCSDGVDNDGDGVTDQNDPGCWKDPSNPKTYDPALNNEAAATTQCQDTKDNDGDSLIDAKDPGCFKDPKNPATYDRTRNNEALAGPGECMDGKDNDNDGVADKDDPGCWTNPTDPTSYNPYGGPESSATTQCQDTKDNDGDSLVDAKDPGCFKDPKNPATYDRTRNNEALAGPGECMDGKDNDNDGVADKDDPGCWTNPTDPTSYNPYGGPESSATTQCQDKKDNDSDTLVDAADPGCWKDPSNSATYDRTRNNEAAATTQCQDTTDNDKDGAIDMKDPGCTAPSDNDESNELTECSDKVDNDNDNLIDLKDPGCADVKDDDESDEASLLTVGVECVTDNTDGTKTAYFSYNNTTTADITVATNEAEGTLNEFVADGSKTTPPTTFKPGTAKGTVVVTFSDDVLTWVVRAPKSALSQAAANSLTPRCKKIEPVAECRGFKDGVMHVRFGYTNPNAFPQEISAGKNNGFAPGVADRGQPVRFFAGKNSSVFEAPLASADEVVTWSINGSSVTAETSLPTCDGQCTDTPTGSVTGNLDRIAGELSAVMNRAAELLASARGNLTRAQVQRNKRDAERAKRKAAQYQARANFYTIEFPAVVKTCPQAPEFCASVDRGVTLDSLRDLYANQRNSVQRTIARTYFRNTNKTNRDDALVKQAKQLEAEGIAELLKLPRVVVECK